MFSSQNKTCVQTLEGHAQNIAAVAFHPELPIILTGSEDGKCGTSVWVGGTQEKEKKKKDDSCGVSTSLERLNVSLP